MNRSIRIFFMVLMCSVIWAQAPTAPKTSTLPPDNVTVSDASYPFPLEEKAKVRDLQYESDQLEIQNQKLQLQIEQNKARQLQLMDQEKMVAFQFANKHQINLDQYELDAAQVRFIKKKKVTP